MFENISYFFKRMVKPEQKELGSKDAAKERLHLVLMQDRANVSADFLELMKQEIIDVIKKYIVVDEKSIDVRLTNKSNEDGTTGAPALYANIPIVNIKNDMMAEKEKKFAGVDFNKEMGITTDYDEEDYERLEALEIEPIPGQEIEANKTTIIENYSDENSETELEESIDEEDDDDVTFDDLLKAAEEEERANKEKTQEAEIENIDVEESNEVQVEKEVEVNDGKSEETEMIENIESDKEESKEIKEDNNKLENQENLEEKIEEKKEEKKTRGRKKKVQEN